MYDLNNIFHVRKFQQICPVTFLLNPYTKNFILQILFQKIDLIHVECIPNTILVLNCNEIKNIEIYYES